MKCYNSILVVVAAVMYRCAQTRLDQLPSIIAQRLSDRHSQVNS